MVPPKFVVKQRERARERDTERERERVRDGGKTKPNSFNLGCCHTLLFIDTQEKAHCCRGNR